MSLTTRSKFYYDYEVTSSNYQLDFDEGGSELTAELSIGSYSMTDFAQEIEDALNTAGALTYTVTVNRTTRVITIAAGSNFTLRISSGSHAGTTAYTLAGFTGANQTGSNSYSGAATGSVYAVQFVLQDYISSDDWVEAVEATVNKSASGKVEVVKFGDQNFVQMNIMYATSRNIGANSVIRYNATGHADLQDFMTYLITRGPVEFMPDEDTPATFQTLMLESTPDNSNGVGYKLKEMTGKNLPGFYETGTLKMRVIT